MGSLADSRDEFWQLGEGQVAERLGAAEHAFGPLRRTRALDFGCGVGRLSLPLARRFEKVVGMDIAPAMLAEAARNAAEAGLGNLDLRLSDDALAGATGAFDLVMSSIVLQHIDVRRGMRIFRELLERVAQGGVIAVDLCIDRRDTSAQALRYWLERYVPGVHALFNIARGRPASEPFMQMNAYSLDEVTQLAESRGFGPAVVVTVPHGRFMVAQLLMQRQSNPSA